jgi:hypothetical protein
MFGEPTGRMVGEPTGRMVDPDTLAPPPDETHEPVIRLKARAEVRAGYEATHKAHLKQWQQSKKELEDWNNPKVREAHLTKWWKKIDTKCRSEIVKDRAKRRRQQALARVHTNLARIELKELKKQLALAQFFGDCGKVRRLEERIDDRCCDLAQREEEEARQAIPDCEKRELSIARAEHLAGLRQESIEELEKEIAKHELEGNAKKVRSLKKALGKEIGPDPLAVAKKAAIAEARREGNWSAGEVVVPVAVKSPARLALEAYLNEVVRRTRAEIMKARYDRS